MIQISGKTLNIDGYFNYSDLASQSVPLVYTSGAPLKLTNDGLGGQTELTYKPLNVSKLWNSITNQFDFSELKIGDELFVRFNINVITSAINQEFRLYLSCAVGGVFPYIISDGDFFFKTPGNHQVGVVIPLYIGQLDTKNFPSELIFSSSNDAEITMNSIYISTKRRI